MRQKISSLVVMLAMLTIAWSPWAQASTMNNQAGSGQDMVVPMVYRPPLPELTISPTSVEKGKPVKLSWTNGGYTSFEVQLGTKSGGLDILKQNVGLVTTYSFDTSRIAANTTIYARIVGVYDEGERTSATQTFTVIPSLDTQPPTSPVVSASSIGDNAVTIKWTASTDNVGVKEYQVYKNGVYVATVTPATTSYSFTGLASGTSYTFYVKAADQAGNTSTSNTLSVTTTGKDTTPPSVPTIQTVSKTHNSITLSYYATDNVGVIGYRIQMVSTGDQFDEYTTATTYTIPNLKSNYWYYFKVTAYDAQANATSSSAYGVQTNPAPVDTQPPTAPVLSSPGKTDKTVSLSWTASTDNVGVTGYDVYVNGNYNTTTTGTSIVMANLQANTAYTFTVKAKDAAGNTASSNTISVTTTPPPPALALTLGSTKITEAKANDGTITDKLVVTLTGSTFVADMSNGVRVVNLPDGLSILVTRDSNTQITIAFLGAAKNHANKDDVTNATVSIDPVKIVGATSTLTSGLFTIDFNDPGPTPGAFTYEYDSQNRLTAIRQNGTLLYEFTYDANGNLTSKSKK